MTQQQYEECIRACLECMEACNVCYAACLSEEDIKRPPAKAGGFRHKCQRLKSYARLKSSQSSYAEAY